MIQSNNKLVPGWILIDKPLNYTSAQIVAIVKKLLKPLKIGHTGTLDPLASGLLPIAINITRLIDYSVNSAKEYEFEIQFGTQTNTGDAEGKIISTTDKSINFEKISDIIKSLEGEIWQTPPIFSALKINGKRAYDLARKGEVFQLDKRPVFIHYLKLVDINVLDHKAKFQVSCSKGTYIRSLAEEISLRLDNLGYISALRRTKVGIFSINDAITLAKLENLVHNGAALDCILPPEVVLDDILAIELEEEKAKSVQNGQTIKVDFIQDTSAYAKFADKLLAIGEITGGYFKPKKVFNNIY